MRGKFKIDESMVYRMPVHFGGYPFYPVRTVYGETTSISIHCETDPEKLLNLIPCDFEILQPLIKIHYCNSRDVAWMSGGEYRLIQTSVPVKYVGNSEGLVGEYVLVIWENKTCPIIGGREEDGMPKIYADIAFERHVNDHWFTAASYESLTFLSIDFQKNSTVSEAEINTMNEHSKVNYFAWRYIPNLGKGGASLSHATLYPQEFQVKESWRGEGAVRWTRLDYEQHPLQSTIINTLADLPIMRCTEALMMKGSAQLNVGDSRILP